MIEFFTIVGIVTTLVIVCHLLGFVTDENFFGKSEEEKLHDYLVDTLAALDGAAVPPDQHTKDLANLIFTRALREGKTKEEALKLMLDWQLGWQKEEENTISNVTRSEE